MAARTKRRICGVIAFASFLALVLLSGAQPKNLIWCLPLLFTFGFSAQKGGYCR